MLKQIYLLAYNTLCAVGWCVVLMTVSKELYETGDVALAASSATPMVTALQAIACMEFVHSVVGLVSGSPLNAFFQLVGRNVIHFGFIYPKNTANLYVVSLYFAWSMAEVIRYPFYGLSVINSCPGPLLWLRYSAFIVLYPIGILSEVRRDKK
jgi:very-long-chain (3R)-3-hydroxyacyl-CoA dehydratase